MGARGPTKKPAELEQLHGNPGHRPTTKKMQFEHPDEVPKPPAFLDNVAKKEWKRLAPKVYAVGILTDADVAAFAAYCESYSQWVAAVKAIQARKADKKSPAPLTFETDKGYQQQVPEIGIANNAKKQMLAFAREFGLTPSSRLDDTTAASTEDSDTSIMDFIKKKPKIEKVIG